MHTRYKKAESVETWGGCVGARREYLNVRIMVAESIHGHVQQLDVLVASPRKGLLPVHRYHPQHRLYPTNTAETDKHWIDKVQTTDSL